MKTFKVKFKSYLNNKIQEINLSKAAIELLIACELKCPFTNHPIYDKKSKKYCINANIWKDHTPEGYFKEKLIAVNAALNFLLDKKIIVILIPAYSEYFKNLYPKSEINNKIEIDEREIEWELFIKGEITYEETKLLESTDKEILNITKALRNKMFK